MAALKGKVAVITGGSSGIGLATAKRFVVESAYVFITGRRQAELDKAVTEIGSNVTAVKGDVSNLDDLDRLYKEVAEKKGKIDIVFANAGFVEMVPTPAATPEHFDKTFDINARGTYFTVQKALPLINDGGSIVLTCSSVWLKGFLAYGTYAATKAALRSFVRTWTTELKDRKIRANVISPGGVETPIIDSQFANKEQADGARAYFASITPLGRMGLPEEIASAALFLASDESSYVAGIDLPVDGGVTAV
ncbi:MAG: SDR family oxidoreductase [Acidobacteriota bacterium]|nr:SDR family oxidoreductase [Acidobacteriota bacterium]